MRNDSIVARLFVNLFHDKTFPLVKLNFLTTMLRKSSSVA